MVKFIENEFTSLRKKVNEMWTLVYNQLERAGESVLTLNHELAQQVIVREKRVNAFELQIDSDVEDIIALYNPVAVDLRFVLAMLKINNDLERLGDFAEGIARFVMSCSLLKNDELLIKELCLDKMIKQVLLMLNTAKNALNEENLSDATSIFGMDSLLDEINLKVPEILSLYVEKHKENIRYSLELAGVFRKLERAGDHITNIAEELVFYIDAKVLKHQGKADEKYPEA